MEHRGEDVSATYGAGGRQTPWQSSSDDYPAADGSDAGYGPDDGYRGLGQPGQVQPGHGGQQNENGQYGQYGQNSSSYEQQQAYGGGYTSPPAYEDYGPPAGGAGGYGGPGAYGRPEDYGHERGANPPSGYGQGGYDSQTASGYGPGPGDGGYRGAGSGYPGAGNGGYQDPNDGYGQPGGYPALPAGSGGYQSPGGAQPGRGDAYPGPGSRGPAPDGAYQGQHGAYPAPDSGYQGSGESGYPGRGGSYQAPGGGYPGQGGYPNPGGGSPQGPGGGDYPDSGASGAYPAPGGGYQAPGANGGYQGPGGGYGDPDRGYGQSGGYPAQSAGSGGYPALPGGPGASYPAQDAGNDWYGGQPAAANGASFADTGSYQLNGRVADEYGTGPRGALPDPARGFGPGPQNSVPQLDSQQPTAVIPALFGPPRGGPQAGYGAAQTERFPENAPYPGYGPDGPGTAGRGPGDGYPESAGPDAYSSYDDYATRGEFAGPAGTNGYADPSGYSGPGGYGGAGFDDFDRQPAPQDGLDGDPYGTYAAAGAPGDPYQDRYGDPAAAGSPGGAGGRGGRGGSAGGPGIGLGPLRGKRLLLAVLAVIAVGIIGVAAYVFVLKPKTPASSPAATGPLPTASTAPSQQACAAQLGIYCHIAARTDDPKPLTTAELYPPKFTNETDKISYSLVSTKLDTKCSTAVIGPDLVTALKAGQCTQVLRASYVSGDGKIMGTIGVVNLATTNEAHHAGKVVGRKDFIAPLTAAKGVASKLGNGTGVVEAEYKGHYLILIWSEFVSEATPKTTAQNQQLEQFGNDLVAGSANIALSQRQVTGKPAKAAA